MSVFLFLALHLAPHASLAVVAGRLLAIFFHVTSEYSLVIRELTFRYEQAVQALFEPEIDEGELHIRLLSSSDILNYGFAFSWRNFTSNHARTAITRREKPSGWSLGVGAATVPLPPHLAE